MEASLSTLLSPLHACCCLLASLPPGWAQTNRAQKCTCSWERLGSHGNQRCFALIFLCPPYLVHPQTIHESKSYRSDIDRLTWKERLQSTCTTLGQRPGLFSDVRVTGNFVGRAGLGQLLCQALVYPHHQCKGSLTFPIMGIHNIQWQGITVCKQSYLLKEQVLCLCQLAARENHHMPHISLHH